MARGFSRAASALPAKSASMSIISCTVLFVNAPVTIGFLEYSKSEIQTIGVLDILGHFVADDRRGLRVILWELLCNLEQTDQVRCFGGVMLERFRVEHGNARRARVEVDRVAAVMNRRIAIVIVEIKLPRHAFQRLVDERSGNSDHLVFRVEVAPAAASRSRASGF